jgi:hypothetical protein
VPLDKAMLVELWQKRLSLPAQRKKPPSSKKKATSDDHRRAHSPTADEK